MAKKPKKIGRPTIYTKKLALEICFELSRGKSLRKLCAEDDMPNIDTVLTWVLDGKHEEFSAQYARARNIQAELMAEEIIEISDDADSVVHNGTEKKSGAYAQNQRLRVDSRKWILSKVLPKKYGEKVDVTSGGEIIKGNTIVLKDFNGAEGK